jgi:hypothetical protein
VRVAARVLVPVLLAGAATGARTVDLLRSTGGIPAHLAGAFEDPVAFQRTPSGVYLIFDRRAHAVYAIDSQRTATRKLVDVGPESGRLLGPTAFDSGPGGIFAVADAPNLVERVQLFNEHGQKVGGFTLPGRASPRVLIGNRVLSGVGSLRFTGRSLLINQPETGALVTEYGLAGTPVRTFGALRPTGQEGDRDVHLALNVGLPLPDPTGGVFFVFTTGEPRFRKYDRDGRLIFERIAQGREIDDLVQALPASWPRRQVAGEWLPQVPALVHTAAVDHDGNLWTSFVVPYTYVFDRDGDLVRRVQFQAAGLVSPTSLFFAGPRRILVTPGLYEFHVN